MAAKCSSSLCSHYFLPSPIFHYCYPAYGNHISKEEKGRIQWLQYAVDRVVLNPKLGDRVHSRLEKLQPGRRMQDDDVLPSS